MGRAFLISILSLVLLPASAGAATFSNGTPLTTSSTSPDVGPLLPYPSAVAVADLPGTVTDAKVTLPGVAYQDADELRAELVGPTGIHIQLFASSCNALDTTSSPRTFTFTDSAPDILPQFGMCPSGDYRPGSGGSTSSFYSPAPAPPHAAAFSALAGSAPNGLWQLYVGDASIGSGGSVTGGWSLDLTTTPPAPPVAVRSSKCKKKKKKKKHGKKRAATAKKKHCKKKKH